MFPRWLSWMFVGVMVYMIYASSGMHVPVTAPATPMAVPTINAATYPALAAATDAQHWKKRLNPDYDAASECRFSPVPEGSLPLKVMEDVPGEGAPAQCGQTIELALTVWNARGGKAYEGALALTLGAQELAAGMDVGLVGIRPDEVRTLLIPPVLLTRHKAASKDFAAARAALPLGKSAVVTVRYMQAALPK